MTEKHMQLKAIFKGNVQGVFFRQHVKEFADQLNILGYVKNLEDGSVEMVAVADKETIEKFLKLIISKPGFGSISDVDARYSKSHTKYNSFDIQR